MSERPPVSAPQGGRPTPGAGGRGPDPRLGPYPPVPEVLRVAAAFLTDKVAAALYADPPLAFRVRVTAHLLEALAAEVARGPAVEAERRAALAAFLDRADDDPAPLPELEAALCERLRAGPPLAPGEEAALRALLLEGLRAELKLTSPRFDPGRHPEKPPG